METIDERPGQQAQQQERQPDEQPEQQERQLRLYTEALASEHYVQARRRIFRQLVESLLYEGVIEAASRERESHGGLIEWSIPGQSAAGERVLYTCKGSRHLTFGRLRLSDEPVMRSVSDSLDARSVQPSSRRLELYSIQPSVQAANSEWDTPGYGEPHEATSLSLFLLEVCQGIGADEARLLHFARELEQTLIHDTLARYVRASQQPSALLEDEDWERLTIEGHPYHPSYKSRIGFRVEDQLTYGPEFGEPIRPLWVAVHKAKLRTHYSLQRGGAVNAADRLHELCGEEMMSRMAETLAAAGVDRADYVLMPIHPWQWQNVIASGLAGELRSGSIIPVGVSQHIHTAQQSIRTLANRSRPELPSLKLSLSIVNTSTSRVIAPHTVQNAPMITDWLQGIARRDSYLTDELRLVMLGEIAGAAYDDRELPEPLRPQVYGVLSCIWRESVYPLLEPGESVIPFNTLTTLDRSSRPVIEPWVEAYGAERWLSELLETSVLPLIHWLFAHGIALESHAQNMLLIHREGRPARIALKDFHDGIRFMRELLAEPELCPELVEVPVYHRRVNRNSFVEASEPAEVRDFMQDALFFINLGELALFIQAHYGVDELDYWRQVRDIVERYQQRFPQHRARYAQLSLFEPYIGIEQLTKRRMYPDDEPRLHQAPNPLAAVALRSS